MNGSEMGKIHFRVKDGNSKLCKNKKVSVLKLELKLKSKTSLIRPPVPAVGYWQPHKKEEA